MTQREIKCHYCDNGQQVLYDPDADPKTVNLDGSKHYHNKQGGSSHPQQQQQLQQQPSPSRQSAIQEAHDENIQASKDLKKSIDELTEQIKQLVGAIVNYNRGK